MSKFVPDAIIDLLLAGIATSNRLDLTADVNTPTDLSNTLANVTLVPGNGNGDFVIQDGVVSGRRATVSQHNAVPITGEGTMRHWVLSLSGVIKCIGTCDEQYLIAGGTIDIPEFSHEISDPV